MKLIKDLAAFAVEESAIACVVFLVVFSLWATSNMVHTAYSTTLVVLAVVGLILNVLMIAGALKLVYDEFKDFQARHEQSVD